MDGCHLLPCGLLRIHGDSRSWCALSCHWTGGICCAVCQIKLGLSTAAVSVGAAVLWVQFVYRQPVCISVFSRRSGNSGGPHTDEVVSVHDMKAYGRVEVQLHAFLNSTLGGGEWSSSRAGPI
jgi:hypothetical protein